jgi:hypothetical protein
VGIRKSIVFAKRKFSSLVLNIFHILIQMNATVSCLWGEKSPNQHSAKMK